MSEEAVQKVPRLCGGIFFSLLVTKASKKITVRSYDDEDKTRGRAKLLRQLGVIAGTRAVKDLVTATNTNLFASCQPKSHGDIRYGNDKAIEYFIERFDKQYTDVLDEMRTLIKNYIDTNFRPGEGLDLIKDIIFLIDKDTTISKNQNFYIRPNGDPVKSKDLCYEDVFFLDTFLLGIWYFVFVERGDNSVGEETYKAYFPGEKYKRAQYIGSIGKDVKLEKKVRFHVFYEDGLFEEEPDPIDRMEILGMSVLRKKFEDVESMEEKKRMLLRYDTEVFLIYLSGAIRLLDDVKDLARIRYDEGLSIKERLLSYGRGVAYEIGDKDYRKQIDSVTGLMNQIALYLPSKPYLIQLKLIGEHMYTPLGNRPSDDYKWISDHILQYQSALYETYKNLISRLIIWEKKQVGVDWDKVDEVIELYSND